MRTAIASHYISDSELEHFWTRDEPLWRRAVNTVIIGSHRARRHRPLQEVSDHLLRDIGVTRADVEFDATKPFWRA